MCKGKSTSATKIQNATESLFSKSKYLYGTFMCQRKIKSNSLEIILNGNKLHYKNNNSCVFI